jgi:hypothetical protein
MNSQAHLSTAQKNLDASIADAVAMSEKLQQCLVEIVARATVLRAVAIVPQSGGGGGEERK